MCALVGLNIPFGKNQIYSVKKISEKAQFVEVQAFRSKQKKKHRDMTTSRKTGEWSASSELPNEAATSARFTDGSNVLPLPVNTARSSSADNGQRASAADGGGGGGVALAALPKEEGGRFSAHEEALRNVVRAFVALQRSNPDHLCSGRTWSTVTQAAYQAEQILLNPWMANCRDRDILESLALLIATWKSVGPSDELEIETRNFIRLVNCYKSENGLPVDRSLGPFPPSDGNTFSLVSEREGTAVNPFVRNSEFNLAHPALTPSREQLADMTRNASPSGTDLFYPTRLYCLWSWIGNNSHRLGVGAARFVIISAVIGLGIWALVMRRLEGIGIVVGCLLILFHWEMIIHHNSFMTRMFLLNGAAESKMVSPPQHSLPFTSSSPAGVAAGAGPPLLVGVDDAFGEPDRTSGSMQRAAGALAAPDQNGMYVSKISRSIHPMHTPLTGNIAFGGFGQISMTAQSGVGMGSILQDQEHVNALLYCGHDLPARQQICDVLWRRAIGVLITDDPEVFLTKANTFNERQRLLLVHVDSLLPTSDWPSLQKLGSRLLVYFITKDEQAVPNIVPNSNVVGFPMRNRELDRLVGVLRGLSIVDVDFLKPTRAFHIPQYVLGKRLGGGTFGNVFEVELDITGGRCAVKRMYIRPDEQPARLHDIAREADIMSRLSHPNIVQFLFCQQEEQCVCIFMELCEGGSLAEFIHAGSLKTAAQFRKILREIITAVCYLHSERIIHRDLKPENVLFRNGVVKVTDFGTAAFKKEKFLTNVMGTFQFMAPEVLLLEPYSNPWMCGRLVALQQICLASRSSIVCSLTQRSLTISARCPWTVVHTFARM